MTNFFRDQPAGNIYRPDIDGLRSLAILLVVFNHAYPALIPGGFIGVDIFFIISGYLISTIIFSQVSSHSFSFKNFYIRRINRIFPALLLVLLSCFIFGWFSLFHDELKQLCKHIAGGAGFVSNIIYWKDSGYFDTSSELKPLLHLWSLAVEEQFYIIWPLLIFAAYKVRLKFLILIILGGLISFKINLHLSNLDASKAFYLLTTRFWELLLGSFLAEFVLKINYFQNFLIKIFKKIKCKYPTAEVIGFFKSIIAFMGFVLILWAAFYFDKTQSFPGKRALVPTMGTLFIIFSGDKSFLNKKFFSHKYLVWVGLISYPLYLWHWPLLSFLRILRVGEPSALLKAVAIFGSFLLAWFTFNFIEKPIKLSSQKQKMSCYLLLSMLFLGIVSYVCFKHTPVRESLGLAKFEKLREFSILTSNPAESCDKTDFSKVYKNNCSISNPDKFPTIALLGDSHAISLFNGFSKHLKKYNENIILLASGGCVPFFDLESQIVRTKDFCLGMMNASLEYALKSPTIKTIILNSRGPLYLTGKGFNEPEHDRYIRYVKEPLNVNFQEIFRHAMEATMSRMIKSGKKIVFFIDVPELGFDPLSCLDLRPFSMGQKKTSCTVDKNEVMKRNKEYYFIVKDVLKNFPQVKIFDQSKYTCDEKYCHAIIEGKFIYRDDDHVSTDGGEYLGAKFLLENL
jgi:peptidoglycan/LPS O-acetylase OafA/YrhL